MGSVNGSTGSWEATVSDDDYEVTTGCTAAHPDRRGGQHVAKQCTAVRILHRPTGIAVLSRDERSQHANRVVAYERLQALLATNTELTRLRALVQERDELHTQLKAIVDYAIDVVGMPASNMLGTDAPVRVMRKLHAERDAARAEVERMRPVYEAAVAAMRDADWKRYAIWLDSTGGERLKLAVDTATQKGETHGE
jgi:hypothetical protein